MIDEKTGTLQSGKIIVDAFKISERRKKVWNIELDLAEKFIYICEKYGLMYYLAGGGLLGWYKYGGFIPWDDDLDFLMPRKDYDQFQKIFDKELTYPYIVRNANNNEKSYFGPYTKLCNVHTTGVEIRELEMEGEFGIWIDICPLDFVFENRLLKEAQIFSSRFMQKMLYAKVYGKHYKTYLDLPYKRWRCYIHLSRIFTYNQLIFLLNFVNTGCRQSSYITSFGGYHGEKAQQLIYEAKTFRNTIDIKFEGIKMRIPKEYTDCFNVLYQDEWKKQYPQEKKGVHHLCILEPDIPYTEYRKLRKDFIDNINHKKMVIFGSGKMARYFLMNQGRSLHYELIVDNNSNRWGQMLNNILIDNPQRLNELKRDNYGIIICSIYHSDIVDQLRSIGIDYDYIFLDERVWL